VARQFRGSSRGRTLPARRKTFWAAGPGGSTTTQISAASGSAFIGSANAANVDGLTVVRIRGELLMYLSAAGSAQDGFTGAFGIGIASLAAVTAGVASVPTPLVEQDSENWLYWKAFSIRSSSSTLASSNAGESVLRVTIDTKAMRKFPQDLSIYSIIEANETGAAVMQVTFDSRILALLP